ncbi:glycoside hydrolase family 26 protein [Marinoscillum furvescens]|uniref:Mannan endo-1,4-beta-mannosidase n=1 Tax=Marinoscillum furvescens DSM 4134 TaxID=1122208 RepID=A0A3D9L3S3_MARFU|nr:glycosyl hydrolase [Marinoscillum furvescens]RED97933.1 mannan endo-1,4-beta-mannosidase [Marinoscillum furvescens DSM 4134]
MKHIFGLFALTILIQQTLAQTPIDLDATRETKSLLLNLHHIAKEGFMFGHQDDLAYGVKWKAEKKRSDVKETVGTYPAVIGWDLGSRMDLDANLDDVRFQNMKRWIKQSYRMGSITTISWHLDNLSTGGNSWDKTPSVSDLLPGGSKHEEFKQQLNLVAAWLDQLRVGWFKRIPVIFRPWHEHNGDWFWWGKGNCSEEEYIELYRFTVDYLKNEKDIHHLLYAFSPDRSRWKMDSLAKSTYFYGYPGDEYVDIIGLDNYGDVGRIGGSDSPELQRKYFIESLELITEIARERGKVAALSETGLEGVTNEKWFTDVLLDPILANDIAIAWVLVWRNANTTHHYAPYPSHPSVADFIKFEEHEKTFFERDMNNPYKSGKALK